MVAGTLSRYFGMRFLGAAASVFGGNSAAGRAGRLRGDDAAARAAYRTRRPSSWRRSRCIRVPQVTERIIPFAALIGAMTCYLTLSRRLELVVARSAGVSAWQFIAPAVIVALHDRGAGDHRLQSDLGRAARVFQEAGSRAVRAQRPPQRGTGGFWVRQRGANGHSIINAASSRKPGAAARRGHRC